MNLNDGSPRIPPPASGSRPVRRSSPLNPRKTRPATEDRLRIWRQRGGTNGVSDTTSENPPITQEFNNAMQGSDAEVQAFSNEYDIDVRVLLDVQRAIRMKARREARLRKGQFSPEKPAASDTISSTLLSPSSSPTPQNKNTHVSNIASLPTPDAPPFPFPVPSSGNPWRILDRKRSGSDDGKPTRKWSLHIGGRRGKETVSPRRTISDRQERGLKGGREPQLGIMHSEVQAKSIGRQMSFGAQTMQRVSTISDQLERRYKLLYCSIASGKPLNLITVARWYDAQDERTRDSMDKADPLTWMKHLPRDGRMRKRSGWDLTALIVEEYTRANNLRDSSKPFIEKKTTRGPAAMTGTTRPPLSSLSYQRLSALSPANLRIADTTYGEHPSGSSFIDELGLQTRKSRESSASRVVHLGSDRASPVNSRNTVSSRASAHSRILSYESPRTNRPAAPFTYNTTQEIAEGLDKDAIMRMAVVGTSEAQRSAKPDIRVIVSRDVSGDEGNPLASTIPINVILSTSDKSAQVNQSRTHLNTPRQNSSSSTTRGHESRKLRVSLPVPSPGKFRRVRGNDDEKAVDDYRKKVAVLEEVAGLNYRIRQILHRTSSEVKEYDLIHSSAMQAFGIPYRSLPRDLLDAFSHDPAGVTGATRRLQGFKAVDDIHKRLARQREIFKSFIYRKEVPILKPASVLKDPISRLLITLEKLDAQNKAMSRKVQEANEFLRKVQQTHSDVKAEYNHTLYHTAVVYPELSQIVALEESIRDQYQQFWEIGMDALTFILDTVAPFWRTYGKQIGEDIRDFLIIPLYRNEFTGEAKWYRITDFPRRSCWHWLGLVFFFVTSVMVNILQLRGAISSSFYFKMRWIPYEGLRYIVLPFFWSGIVFQWMAVVVEFIIVFLQLTVVAWWVGWSVKAFS